MRVAVCRVLRIGVEGEGVARCCTARFCVDVGGNGSWVWAIAMVVTSPVFCR